MTELPVQRILSDDDRTSPVFLQVDELMRRIRDRAAQLCVSRGSGDGHALDDWLAAEREISWPAGELVERDKDFVFNLAVPGYKPDELAVTATPFEIIVRAAAQRKESDESSKNEKVCWTEFLASDLYRRLEVPAEIDAKKVMASVENGLLKITAPKRKTAERSIAVAAVA